MTESRRPPEHDYVNVPLDQYGELRELVGGRSELKSRVAALNKTLGKQRKLTDDLRNEREDLRRRLSMAEERLRSARKELNTQRTVSRICAVFVAIGSAFLCLLCIKGEAIGLIGLVFIVAAIILDQVYKMSPADGDG